MNLFKFLKPKPKSEAIGPTLAIPPGFVTTDSRVKFFPPLTPKEIHSIKVGEALNLFEELDRLDKLVEKVKHQSARAPDVAETVVKAVTARQSSLQEQLNQIFK